jgi:hypothetical protein
MMTPPKSMSLVELREQYPKLRIAERESENEEANRQRYLFRLSFLKTAKMFPIAALGSVATAVIVSIGAPSTGGDFSALTTLRLLLTLFWLSFGIYRLLESWSDYSFMPVAIPDAYAQISKKYPRPLVLLIACGALLLIGWWIIYIEPLNYTSHNRLLIDRSDTDLSAVVKITVTIGLCSVGTIIFFLVLLGITKNLLKGGAKS